MAIKTIRVSFMPSPTIDRTAVYLPEHLCSHNDPKKFNWILNDELAYQLTDERLLPNDDTLEVFNNLNVELAIYIPWSNGCSIFIHNATMDELVQIKLTLDLNFKHINL